MHNFYSAQPSDLHKIDTSYMSCIRRLWLVAWLHFTDAAKVETVTPVISWSWIGQTVTFTSKADGSPTPTLSWKNPSGKVIKQVIDLTNTVDVLMISDQDFGNYTCEATNEVNTDTSTVQVQQISKWNINCSSAVYSAVILLNSLSRMWRIMHISYGVIHHGWIEKAFLLVDFVQTLASFRI